MKEKQEVIMNKVKKILWGVVLIIFGVLLILDITEVLPVNFFFDGWWTLIIVVPCAIGLITDRHKIGNLIGLMIGVALMLAARGIISYGTLGKLIIPALIIVIGVFVICRAIGKKEAREVAKKLRDNKAPLQDYSATFSSQEANYSGEVFSGASLNAVFGSVKLDLRGAVINDGAVIKASAVFGGINILLPDDVNVKVSSSSVFGGVSTKKRDKQAGAPTLYISASGVFGGCDIK